MHAVSQTATWHSLQRCCSWPTQWSVHTRGFQPAHCRTRVLEALSGAQHSPQQQMVSKMHCCSWHRAGFSSQLARCTVPGISCAVGKSKSSCSSRCFRNSSPLIWSCSCKSSINTCREATYSRPRCSCKWLEAREASVSCGMGHTQAKSVCGGGQPAQQQCCQVLLKCRKV